MARGDDVKKAAKRAGKAADEPAGSPRALAEGKLRASGIAPADAERLGVKELNRAEIQAMFKMAGAEVPRGFAWETGLHVPYYDTAGGRTGYFRVRGLTSALPFGASPSDAKGRPFKYAGPSDVTPQLYLPPTEDWEAILADPSRRVAVTEGELKAASACLHGEPCVAVGGVWMFTSKKAGVWLDPVLERLAAGGREVVIAFDSDQIDKPDVLHAQSQLARRLTDAGAAVKIASIAYAAKEAGLDPAPKGLDDWIVAHLEGEPRRAALRALLEGAEDHAGCVALHELNLRYAVLDRPAGWVVDLETGQLMKAQAFEFLNRNRWFTEQKGETLARVPAAKAWSEWPLRQTAKGMVYRPGAARLTDDGRVNRWTGFAVESREGELGPYFELMDWLFPDTEEGRRNRAFMERWMAYPLQATVRPELFPRGPKMYMAAVLWSQQKGVGKNTLAELLAGIYGKKSSPLGGNFALINNRTLKAPYTGYLDGVQLVTADEVTGSDNREHMDTLKGFITDETVRVNDKFVPEFEIENVINWLMFSNHPDAFFLESDDRRFWIHEVTSPPLALADPARTARISGWKNGGDAAAAALFHRLLGLDLADFDPHGHAPDTEAKRAMTEVGLGDLACWVARLLEDPTAVLGEREIFKGALPAGRDLWSTDELTALFNGTKAEGTKPVSKASMRKALTRARLRQVGGSGGLRVGTRVLRGIWAVRNGDRWLAAEPKDAARHLIKYTASGPAY